MLLAPTSFSKRDNAGHVLNTLLDSKQNLIYKWTDQLFMTAYYVHIWATAQQNQQNDMWAQWRHRSAWASTRSDHWESSLCTLWVAKDPTFLHSDCKDTGQTVWMHRLIWAFAGCTGGFVVRWLIYHCLPSQQVLSPYSDNNNLRVIILTLTKCITITISFSLMSL